MALKIIPTELLLTYRSVVTERLQQSLDDLRDAPLSTPDFSFYTSVASVFSSKIEGENIEIDSYIRHKRDGLPFQKDYTRKTDDLYAAYLFAKEHPLNEWTVQQAHQCLSKHLLPKVWQGRYRTQNMYVASADGKIAYVAAPPDMVSQEMSKLFSDIEELLNQSLTIEEVFFYASMIHLVFVKIHPWNDGNGRTARLLEKWFLAEKAGEKAWFIQSEKMYYEQQAMYFRSIRALGIEYEQLDYSKALPFLLLLPESLKTDA